MNKKTPVRIICLLIGIIIMSVGMGDRILFRFGEPTHLESLGSSFLTSWGWLILLVVGSFIIITTWGWSSAMERLRRLHWFGKAGLSIALLVGIVDIFANLISPRTTFFISLLLIGIAGFITFAISYRISGREKVSI